MNTVKISEYSIQENELETEVTIVGKQENDTDLIIKGIQKLMSQIDVKHACNEDHERFNKYIETLLLSVADIVGYEHYYWEQVPDSEKKYNEYDELEVSREEKIKLLKIMVENL
ncbi:hypothetical protein [Alkalihalophilus marmarensis]|uniref:hypothetical protein n=1 Tax=Alkalihalophilus marmarensis TaxID=521377 RepID=UPI002E2370B2|nr:hypothetical protein [Alkalihalophilus marmarensis]